MRIEQWEAQDPPEGRLISIGEQKLALYERGRGPIPVIFIPGGGAVGLDYWAVHSLVAQDSWSVLYDRAGTGWSTSTQLPRTLDAVTEELNHIVNTLTPPTPPILVGHSLGGLYARGYAQRYPVMGLVLLDPDHEDYRSFMPTELAELYGSWDPDAALPAEFPQELLQLYRDLFAAEMIDWPDHIRSALLKRHVSMEWLRAGIRESGDPLGRYKQIRGGGPIPDVRTIVLCSTRTDGFKDAVSVGQSQQTLQAEIEGKNRLYAEFAASLPRGETRMIAAGHATMHYRYPRNIAEAVQDVLCST